jgi:hypothetical protein
MMESGERNSFSRHSEYANRKHEGDVVKHFYSLTVLLLGAFVAAGSARAKTPALQGGPMLSCASLPCVDITLKNGKHIRMIVDLGDANSVVDSSVAKEMDLMIDPISLKDRSGSQIASDGRAVLEGARMGGASLGDIPVLVADLPSIAVKGRTPEVEGVLAYTAFKDRMLRLDYKHHRVLVSEPLSADPPCLRFCGDMTASTIDNSTAPVLLAIGFALNGTPVTARLDTMFDGTMLITPGAVKKLNLLQENASTSNVPLPYRGSGFIREAHAHRETFGSQKLAGDNSPLFFAPPQMKVPNGVFDVTVGQELFQSHVLTLDFHSGHFWMTS